MAIEYYSPVDINGNLAIRGGGPSLTIQDTTDDDDQQILFVNSSGTVDYRIHTADFTGAGGGDGMYIGSTQSDGEVCLVTHDTIALTLDTSQNGTFAGNATAANLISNGYVKLAADDQLISDGSITVEIDYNNNQTDRFFKIRKDNSTDLFTLNEDASAAFVGNVTATANNATISAAESGGATTKIMGASVGRVGTSSNHNLEVLSNNTAAITIDTSQNATFAAGVTVTGNITANGNIIGDDGTNITNIQRVEADAYAADADNTTVINLGASEITCLVADTDVFQITDTDFIYDPAVKVSIHKRKLAKTSNTDGDADGDIVYFGGTTSMTAGAVYHFKSDGTWEKADADSAATCDGLLGVALGAASDTNGVLLRGMVTIANDPGAVGDVLFLSTTAGQATATAPSGDGDIVRVIGYCLDASNGQIYFNPDGTFVEVTA